MKRIAFLWAFIVLTLTACRNTPRDNKLLSFGGDSFVERTLSCEEGTAYRNDSLFLGNPYLLRFHPAGFLVFRDENPEGQISIVDLKTGSVRSIIKRGRGPSELLNVRDLVVHGEDIWLSSMQESKVIRLSLAPEKRRFVIDTVFQFPNLQFLRILPFSDRRFLMLCPVSPGNRMMLLSEEGTVLDTVGSYPSLQRAPDFIPNNAVFQSDIAISPDFNHTAVVCRSIDYIDLYDSSFDLQQRLHGPLKANIGVKVLSSGGFTRYLQDPMYFMYDNVVCDNARFMVGYVGVRPQSAADLEARINRVFLFDWEGHPLKAYRFDKPIVTFDMDWNSKKLYCVANTPEPRIITFDVSD